MLTAHPDAGFVQIQLNYADWENPDVTARENYEVARRQYAEVVKNGGRASDCIACGQCERACPQQIDVITRLKDCAISLTAYQYFNRQNHGTCGGVL